MLYSIQVIHLGERREALTKLAEITNGRTVQFPATGLTLIRSWCWTR